MKRSLVFLVAFMFSLTLASACLTVNSQTTSGFLNEIPSINSQLSSSCVASIPAGINSIIKDGNILVSVNMNSGSVENFYATIQGQKLISFTKGTVSNYTHEVTLSENTLDSILQSSDRTNSILQGVSNGDIKVRANTFVGKIVWFFAKFFLPKPTTTTTTTTVTGPTGKPDYCDDTYLPGHRDYAENKELWDSYSADTDRVCQSQYGKGTPLPCIYTIQLSISGNPYYLCWYNL